MSAALGLVAALVGLVLATSGVGGGLLARVGFALAAVVAGLAALNSLLVRSVDGPETPTLGRPPDRPGVRRPGDDVDRQLAAVDSGQTLARNELGDRLEDAAIDVLARRYGATRERAREQLREGAWTDDEVAAAVFRDTRRRPSLRDRVQVLLGGESTFRRRVARATDDLWRRRRGVTDGDADGSGPTEGRR